MLKVEGPGNIQHSYKCTDCADGTPLVGYYNCGSCILNQFKANYAYRRDLHHRWINIRARGIQFIARQRKDYEENLYYRSM